MAKVKLTLGRITIPQKVQLVQQIVAAMTGNANFTTPAPTLASVTGLGTALETAFNDAQAARLAAQQKTTLQTAAEQSLDAALAQLAAYVENASAGDPAKIQSAGMDVRADGAPIGPLPAPLGLVALVGDMESEIDLDWDSVRGATSYVVQRSPDPITPTSWLPAIVVTKSKGTVSGLVSGTKYWFRVAAVGAAGQGAWSDPATKVAP